MIKKAIKKNNNKFIMVYHPLFKSDKILFSDEDTTSVGDMLNEVSTILDIIEGNEGKDNNRYKRLKNYHTLLTEFKNMFVNGECDYSETMRVQDYCRLNNIKLVEREVRYE